MYYEIFVFGLDGPMELHNDEDRDKHQGLIFDKIAETFKEKGRLARLKGEEALKMKAMRIFRFGRHIAKVPRMYVARHYDYPMSESKAAHISLEPQHTNPLNFEPRNSIPSQHLKGNMIPMTEDQMKTLESVNMGVECAEKKKAQVGDAAAEKPAPKEDEEEEMASLIKQDGEGLTEMGPHATSPHHTTPTYIQ